LETDSPHNCRRMLAPVMATRYIRLESDNVLNLRLASTLILTQNNEKNTKHTTTTTSAFNSADFASFLNSNIINTEKNPFLSKESSDSVFKSREFFSDLYSSKEWDLGDLSEKPPKPIAAETPKTFDASVTKSADFSPKLLERMDWDSLSAEDIKSTAEELVRQNVSLLAPPLPPPKAVPFPDALKSQDWSFSSGAILNDIDYSPDILEDALLCDDLKPTEKTADFFSSRDWGNLGRHVDIALSPEIFRSGDDSPDSEPPAGESTKTDWSALLIPQLAPLVNAVPVTDALASAPPATDADPPKKKRKRKKRKKVVPDHKEYVNICDQDVLLGRGGRSNHHPGNKRYREEVENFRTLYSALHTDKEKTDMSQLLVDVIQKTGGRFLEEDKVKDGKTSVSLGWYVAPNIVSRRKASQALREDNDPEKRKAKRARFLAKKKAVQGY
jgi:hypothetical protein